MSVANLIADLDRLEIQLETRGDRLRYWPRSAVTPELAQRMKAHKCELLTTLQSASDVPSVGLTDAPALWQAALDRLAGDVLFLPDVMEALRAADAQWADAPGDEIANN